MNYRHITFKENQERAHEILDFYGITSKSDMPVDPEPILRKMGISIVPFRGLKFRHGPLGFVTKTNSDLQVWVDEHHYINQPESSLFTIGEELVGEGWPGGQAWVLHGVPPRFLPSGGEKVDPAPVFAVVRI